MPETKQEIKGIISYVGTAGHLSWLLHLLDKPKVEEKTSPKDCKCLCHDALPPGPYQCKKCGH